jgi:hypothetical protein
MAEVVVLACGPARWPESELVPVIAVPPRPRSGVLDRTLDSLNGRRLVVCGCDADLAAVLLRLLRTEALTTVVVGYVPVGAPSAVARLWGLPAAPAAAASLALDGVPERVPLVRDDAGGVLAGRGVVAPVEGVLYCDDAVLLRGRAARLEVTPDRASGLAVRVSRGRLLGGLGFARQATGRAVQLGCHPTTAWRDGVACPINDRWTWYRHTEDWHLVCHSR